MSLQSASHGDIGLLHVVILHWISLIQLIPPSLVETRIMIARGRDTDFVEIGEREHGMCCAITSGGRSEDSDTLNVHVRILGGHLLDHGDVIFEGASKIPVGELMK